MTDQPDAQEEQKPDIQEGQEPDLHPLYRPAVIDSALMIRFVGNTAVVASMELAGADPYQMLAAGRDLERRAFQMIQMAEIEEAKERARERIPTASDLPDLPPGGFKQV